MTLSRFAFAAGGLGLGLLFYLAYRTDQTLSNRLLHACCGTTRYLSLKAQVSHWLFVPAPLRGCLPSALWCLIVSSLFGGWKLRVRPRAIGGIGWFCPWFNAAWEVVQSLGWTDGRADSLDVIAGFAGWGVTQLVFMRARPTVSIASLRWPWRLAIVTAGFACMGFADVWK